MKYLVIIAILISAPTFARAVSDFNDPAEGCVECVDKKPSSIAGSGGELSSTEGLSAIMSPPVDPARLKKLQFLARKLCGFMKYDDEVFIPAAKRIVSSFRKKFDGIEHSSDEDILRFLNENRFYLYCELPLGGEEHYMVYAVNNNQISKLFSMFLNTLTTDMKVLAPNVDVIVGNSLEGEPETILDVLKRKSLEKGRSKDFVDAMNSKISQFQDDYDAKYYHEFK